MDDELTLNDALVQCVKAAGGSKVVGAKLWPEMALEQAQRALLDCLNDERPRRLSPDQVLLVAQLARDAGCHAYMQHCAQRLGYQTPVPHEPQQQLAELQRQFGQALAQQQVLLGAIQTLMGQLPPGSTGLKAVA